MLQLIETPCIKALLLLVSKVLSKIMNGDPQLLFHIFKIKCLKIMY